MRELAAELLSLLDLKVQEALGERSPFSYIRDTGNPPGMNLACAYYPPRAKVEKWVKIHLDKAEADEFLATDGFARMNRKGGYANTNYGQRVVSPADILDIWRWGGTTFWNSLNPTFSSDGNDHFYAYPWADNWKVLCSQWRIDKPLDITELCFNREMFYSDFRWEQITMREFIFATSRSRSLWGQVKSPFFSPNFAHDRQGKIIGFREVVTDDSAMAWSLLPWKGWNDSTDSLIMNFAADNDFDEVSPYVIAGVPLAAIPIMIRDHDIDVELAIKLVEGSHV
jgi:hypothetical protein